MQALKPQGQQPSFTKYFLEDPSLVDRVDHTQKKKIVLYDLPQIELYRKLNKPMVSEQKKRIIKEKLDLQQQSLLQTKEREKRNEYFLNYSENPFVDMTPHLKTQKFNVKTQGTQKSNTQNSSKPQKQTTGNGVPDNMDDLERQNEFDIVTQLNSMVEKQPKAEFLKLKDDFKWMMKNADLFSNKIIEISAKKEDFQFFKDQKTQTNKLVEMIIEKGLGLASQRNRKTQKDRLDQRTRTQQQKNFKKDASGKPILDMLPENILSFEDIIKIKEENFFMRQDPLSHKPMNIFKVSVNKNQKQMVGKELLNKYNFSFTSMVEKIQKIKIPIYRDISRMARRISLGKSTQKDDRFDYIESYELSFKTNALSFADLMSVASFRFSPEFVYKTTNFDIDQNIVKETSQTSSQQMEEHIFYDQNTKNISVRYHNKGEEEQEILNYLKLQYNARQVKYQNQCERYKLAISADLHMKEKLVSTTIQDRKLHGDINVSIKKQLKRFVNMDERQVEIDRLIRMNKMNKNKNVAIKLGKILEVLDIKKNHDQVINKLGIVEEDSQSNYSEDERQQTNRVGRDRIKLKPRTKPKTRLNMSPTVNKQTAYNTPKFGDENPGSKTPQKASTILNNSSRTPTKRNFQANTSKNSQKKPETEDMLNRTTTKNTVKKVGAWKF